jgi:hypothetical protein
LDVKARHIGLAGGRPRNQNRITLRGSLKGIQRHGGCDGYHRYAQQQEYQEHGVAQKGPRGSHQAVDDGSRSFAEGRGGDGDGSPLTGDGDSSPAQGIWRPGGVGGSMAIPLGQQQALTGETEEAVKKEGFTPLHKHPVPRLQMVRHC